MFLSHRSTAIIAPDHSLVQFCTQHTPFYALQYISSISSFISYHNLPSISLVISNSSMMMWLDDNSIHFSNKIVHLPKKICLVTSTNPFTHNCIIYTFRSLLIPNSYTLLHTFFLCILRYFKYSLTIKLLPSCSLTTQTYSMHVLLLVYWIKKIVFRNKVSSACLLQVNTQVSCQIKKMKCNK